MGSIQTLATSLPKAGGELGRLHSLRSSTALVLNVFQPWKAQPWAIGEMFGAGSVREIAFEKQQPIWPASDDSDSTPPHLDVLLTGTGPTVGIESKFLELYTPAANAFRPSHWVCDGILPLETVEPLRFVGVILDHPNASPVAVQADLFNVRGLSFLYHKPHPPVP